MWLHGASKRACPSVGLVVLSIPALYPPHPTPPITPTSWCHNLTGQLASPPIVSPPIFGRHRHRRAKVGRLCPYTHLPLHSPALTLTCTATQVGETLEEMDAGGEEVVLIGVSPLDKVCSLIHEGCNLSSEGCNLMHSGCNPMCEGCNHMREGCNPMCDPRCTVARRWTACSTSTCTTTAFPRSTWQSRLTQTTPTTSWWAASAASAAGELPAKVALLCLRLGGAARSPRAT